MNKRKREDNLWKALDQLAFWLSGLAILILTLGYFAIPSFIVASPLRDFLLGIITNLIPVFLLFALSYAFLRQIQSIRSEQETDFLVEKVINSLKVELLTDLSRNQNKVAAEVSKIQTDIAGLGQTVQEQIQQKKIKILFITASPRYLATLRISDEVRQIREGLRTSKFASNFEFILEIGVRKSDLQTLLIEYKPDIFHFSGHSASGDSADEKGLALEDTQGNCAVLTEGEFSRLISIFRNNIQLVFLNGNSSLVEPIAKEIDFVVGGNNQDISDDDAIEFSTAFYHAIGNNVDVETAFNLGCARLANKVSKYRLIKPNKDVRKYFLSTV